MRKRPHVLELFLLDRLEIVGNGQYLTACVQDIAIICSANAFRIEKRTIYGHRPSVRTQSRATVDHVDHVDHT